MSELRSRRRGPCVLAVILPLCLPGGCETQLALKDPYYAETREMVARHGEEVERMVRYNRALRAARATCLQPATGGKTPVAPIFDPAGGREALADLCDVSRGRSPEAAGTLLNAYGRWRTGGVLELPDAAKTAAGAGGGGS